MPNTKHMYEDRFSKLIQEATEMLNQVLPSPAHGPPSRPVWWVCPALRGHKH